MLPSSCEAYWKQQNTADLFYPELIIYFVHEVRVKLQLWISLLGFLLLLFCSNQCAENLDNHMGSKGAEVLLWFRDVTVVTYKLMETWWINRKGWITGRKKGSAGNAYFCLGLMKSISHWQEQLSHLTWISLNVIDYGTHAIKVTLVLFFWSAVICSFSFYRACGDIPLDRRRNGSC